MNNKEHGHTAHRHDLHGVMTPSHEAFNDLIKQNVKSRILDDKTIMKHIGELGDIGYSLISEHLESTMADIARSYKETQAHH